MKGYLRWKHKENSKSNSFVLNKGNNYKFMQRIFLIILISLIFVISFAKNPYSFSKDKNLQVSSKTNDTLTIEEIIFNEISRMPEIQFYLKTADKLISNLDSNERGNSYSSIWMEDENNKKFYIVKVGIHNSDKDRAEICFHVYIKNKKILIKYYDTFLDKEIPLNNWKKKFRKSYKFK